MELPFENFVFVCLRILFLYITPGSRGYRRCGSRAGGGGGGGGVTVGGGWQTPGR